MIGAPLGFLALLALPAIVGIHLFRRRFRRRPVAGLFLWADPSRDPSAGRRRHRLERSLSLLLELLIALLLAAYLIDLRLDDRQALVHEVIVLDDTASMGAGDTAERARRRVAEILDDAGPRAQVSLVAAGRRARLLAGPAVPAAAARGALEDWRPRSPSSELGAGLELARELAGPDRIVRVVTDRVPERRPGGPFLDWHAVGLAEDNVAILAARRERLTGERDRVWVALGRYSPAGANPTRRLELRLEGPAGTLRREVLEIAADGRAELAFEIEVGDADVELRLEADALPIDDVALLLRPAADDVAYRLDFADEDPRRALLERTLRAVGGTAPVAGDLPPDLVFAPTGVEAAVDAQTWWCRFGPFADAPPDAAPTGLLGPFLAERGHPLLEGTSFDGVIWRGARGGGAGWAPLLSAGGLLLIGADLDRDVRSLTIDVELGSGSFVRSPDWPILVANLVALRAAALPGSRETNLRIGATPSVTLPPGDEDGWTLRSPDGDRRPLAPLARVVLAGLDAAGVWAVERGDRVLHRFGVGFRDAEESDLRDAVSARIEPELPAERDEREAEALVDPRLHLPLTGLALLLFLWNAALSSGPRRRGEAA